jgi:hypothetical protein
LKKKDPPRPIDEASGGAAPAIEAAIVEVSRLDEIRVLPNILVSCRLYPLYRVLYLFKYLNTSTAVGVNLSPNNENFSIKQCGRCCNVVLAVNLRMSSLAFCSLREIACLSKGAILVETCDFEKLQFLEGRE